MNKRLDNIILGIVTGFLVPVLTIAIVYLYTFRANYTFVEFLDYLRTMRAFSKTVSLCIIPNLLLFFIYIWTNNDKSARGVLGSTFFWALVVLILKFTL